jgi:hypothetical protein
MDKLTRLKHEKASHLTAAAQIDQQIQEVENLKTLAAKHGYVLVDGGQESKEAESVIVTGESTAARAKQASVQLIAKAARPMPLLELYDRLLDLGIEIGGITPKKTLSSYLARCSELVATSAGWKLNDNPAPGQNGANEAPFVRRV